MKRNLFIVLISVLLTACGALKNAATSSTNSNTVTASAKPAVGDSVVAKNGTEWFTEGKIRVIDGQKANIAWSQKDSTPGDVDLANVYLLPKPGAQPNVKTDDFAIAKTSSSADNNDWTYVQVTSAGKDVIGVKDRNDSSYNLSPDKVIAVSLTDAADIKGAFDKNTKQLDFDKKAQAGHPVVPNGYKPKVGETVVAPSQPQFWYVGQVKSISGERATIIYDPKQNSTFDADLDKIVPGLTPASAPLPAVGDYILVKSPTCANCFLTYTQVTAVNGTNIEAKDRYDTKYTTKPGDFLVLK